MGDQVLDWGGDARVRFLGEDCTHPVLRQPRKVNWLEPLLVVLSTIAISAKVDALKRNKLPPGGHPQGLDLRFALWLEGKVSLCHGEALSRPLLNSFYRRHLRCFLMPWRISQSHGLCNWHTPRHFLCIIDMGHFLSWRGITGSQNSLMLLISERWSEIKLPAHILTIFMTVQADTKTPFIIFFMSERRIYYMVLTVGFKGAVVKTLCLHPGVPTTILIVFKASRCV